jgi:hypothetical protein
LPKYVGGVPSYKPEVPKPSLPLYQPSVSQCQPIVSMIERSLAAIGLALPPPSSLSSSDVTATIPSSSIRWPHSSLPLTSRWHLVDCVPLPSSSSSSSSRSLVLIDSVTEQAILVQTPSSSNGHSSDKDALPKSVSQSIVNGLQNLCSWWYVPAGFGARSS